MSLNTLILRHKPIQISISQLCIQIQCNNITAMYNARSTCGFTNRNTNLDINHVQFSLHGFQFEISSSKKCIRIFHSNNTI
jgi:hypothetical protein